MIFAAKEAVERRAMEKGRRVGEQAERERIMRELEKSGVEIPPEVARIISPDSKDRS